MSNSPNIPARKKLPVKPSLEHLKKQAKRLAKSHSIPLTEAQHQLAKDYGAKNWTGLAHIVETMNRGANQHLNVKYEMEALPKAANQSDLEKVKAILASGEFTQHDLDLALARSVLRFKERREIAQLLIEHGADPDGQYGSDYGPIVFATGESLDPDGLQFLIDHGADVTFPPIDTKYGKQSPLSYFIGSYVRGQNERKHKGIQILLNHKARIPEEITAELLAIHQGDTQTLEKLLTQNPQLITQHYPTMPYGNLPLLGATLLHAAIEFGELECIDLLLARGANPNARAQPQNRTRSVSEGTQALASPIPTPKSEIPTLKSEISNLKSEPLTPTPIFHAIATLLSANLPILEHLLKNHPGKFDLTLRATFTLSDGTLIPPVTPLEYAQLAATPETPDWRRTTQKELDLLQTAQGTRSVSAGTQELPSPIPISDPANPSEISNLKSEIITAFLLAATPDPEADHKSGNLSRALKLFAENPTLPADNFYAACALGYPDAIRSHLEKSPSLAATPGGPRNWPPLCYLTFSKFLRLQPQEPRLRHSRGFLACAQLLLDHGADPNSFWTLPSNPTYKEAALYGAAGLANNPDLTQLLLDRGADPNDGESLYHASEFENPAALAVLLDSKKLNPDDINYCLCHKLDYEHPDALKLYLHHHADPNVLLNRGQRKGDRPLHFALIRGRSTTILEILLQHGADPNLPDAAGTTPHQLALTLGRLDAAQLLLAHGANNDATPKHNLLAALSTANAPRAHELLTQHPTLLTDLTPEDHSILIDAAAHGNTPAVQLMLSPPFNFPTEIRKPAHAAWDGTPLHHACWNAHPETAKLLLEHGADPHLKHCYGGNALTTTVHAAIHNIPKDLPQHLETLTLLAKHFSTEDLKKAADSATAQGNPELANHLHSLV